MHALGCESVTRNDDKHLFPQESSAAPFSPILSVDQAVTLIQTPPATIYRWHSQNTLTGCGFRIGKHLRFLRDRLVRVATQSPVSPKLSDDEISEWFEREPWLRRFPAVLSLPQASDLLQVSTSTLYSWRSEGRLTGVSRKIGKCVRFSRNHHISELVKKGTKL